MLNADKGLFPLDGNCKPWPRYFPVPSVSIISAIYPDKWTGTDALIYNILADMMSKSGNNELPLVGHWLKAVSKNTLSDSEERLEQTDFIRVKDGGRIALSKS